MYFTIQKKDPFNVIGIELQVNNPDEALYKIDNFWRKFRDQKIKDQISNKINPDETIAVYTNYNVEGQGYSLILGARVKDLINDIPEGMVGIEIPEQTYAIFSKKGSIPEIIQDGWKQVWEEPLARAYTYDFELYKDESLDNGSVEFYVAVVPDYSQAA
ncbi:MAG: GyrI-like domain-containing protein [Candidatus Babeliales bacterium]